MHEVGQKEIVMYDDDSQIDDLRVVRGAVEPGKGRIVVSIVRLN